MNPQSASVNVGNSTTPASVSPSITPSPGFARGRGSILYVDDDEMARTVLGGWLRLNGYDHRNAASPIEADTILTQHVFDLVISDIHMPGNHRLEWVEQVLNRD